MMMMMTIVISLQTSFDPQCLLGLELTFHRNFLCVFSCVFCDFLRQSTQLIFRLFLPIQAALQILTMSVDSHEIVQMYVIACDAS